MKVTRQGGLVGVNTSEMLGGADGGADYSHRREYKKYRIVVNVVIEEMEKFWNSMC